MNETTRKFSKELNSGTTALALLAVLVKSSKPIYGYDLGMQLASNSEDGLPMNQGALYPVLRSLEKAGLLTSEISPSSSGPPRRYYKPTAEGKAEFREWCVVWNRTRDWIQDILEQKDDRRSQPTTRRR